MANITIIDTEYKKWLKALALRYRKSQIKAAVKVNTEQLFFYLSLGKNIADRQEENIYGSNFYANLSRDLREEIPGIEGLSETNIRYCKRFYLLYCEAIPNLPQAVEDISSYELEKFYPVKVEDSIPSTEEIEANLIERINKG